jgi:regulator of ribonuclease activity A
VKVSTSDLCDQYANVRVAEPIFSDFGGLEAFHGRIATLKVFEDNALVRTLLEEAGDGRVLVIDGGGSIRCALVGGNLAALAATNGWHGVIVNGCVRDTEELQDTELGVKAIATHPRKSEKGLHTGHRGMTVHFAGISFKSGDWLYADADGIVVSEHPVHVPDAS